LREVAGGLGGATEPRLTCSLFSPMIATRAKIGV
jgi:hypothetical protein